MNPKEPGQKEDTMKILFAAAECVPFVKTGGLADVMGALPVELARQGHEVRVILPLYRQMSQEYSQDLKHCIYFYINLGWRRQYVGIEMLTLNGVTYYFIDNKYYFDRDSIYGLGGDEGERYAFFCKAVLEALPLIGFDVDILHCNDWQTGMIPALLKLVYKGRAFYDHIKTVYTVHNLQYQGIFPIDYVEDLLSLGYGNYTSDKLEFFGSTSFGKAGLVFADEVTTVSPTYAQEIMTPYYGERLDGLLRQRQDTVHGILNGIDVEDYDPLRDPYLEKHYGPTTFIEGKKDNKLSLQRQLGLEESNCMLMGMVTRLSSQKGIDLVERVINEIMDMDLQMVVLGTGDERYENLFHWAENRFHGRFAVRTAMDTPLAHRIYGGADAFLMPSAFEPCGLSQMIAMRYGTLPIVRETGGLKDTVKSFNEETKEGNGFTFYSYNAHDMLHAVERAVDYYTGRKDDWIAMQQAGMAGDYSWSRSAVLYSRLYEKLC